MFNAYLKSMHDLGLTVNTDEGDSLEEAKELAKDMIREADMSVVEFDYDEGTLRGYDKDDTESMYYATFEEKVELTLAELDQWFEDEAEYDDDFSDQVDFLVDNSGGWHEQ